MNVGVVKFYTSDENPVLWKWEVLTKDTDEIGQDIFED